MCVSIKLWFRKPLAQVRFKSNSESRYLIKVSAVKFRKKKLFLFPCLDNMITKNILFVISIYCGSGLCFYSMHSYNRSWSYSCKIINKCPCISRYMPFKIQQKHILISLLCLIILTTYLIVNNDVSVFTKIPSCHWLLQKILPAKENSTGTYNVYRSWLRKSSFIL